MANIRIVEESIKKGGVNNPKAYLLKAIQNDYRDSKEVQKEQENAKKREMKRVEEFKIQEIASSQKEWYDNMQAVIDQLPESELSKLKSSFLEHVE